MRPIRFARGQMIDICYLCERQSPDADDETVLKRMMERDRKGDPDKDDTEN